MYFRSRNWMKTKNKKKVFSGNGSHFSPELGKDHLKKVFTAGCDHFRQEIWRVIQYWMSIFSLVIQLTTFDGRTPKPRWGTLNLDGGGR